MRTPLACMSGLLTEQKSSMSPPVLSFLKSWGSIPKWRAPSLNGFKSPLKDVRCCCASALQGKGSRADGLAWVRTVGHLNSGIEGVEWNRELGFMCSGQNLAVYQLNNKGFLSTEPSFWVRPKEPSKECGRVTKGSWVREQN